MMYVCMHDVQKFGDYVYVLVDLFEGAVRVYDVRMHDMQKFGEYVYVLVHLFEGAVRVYDVYMLVSTACYL
jgi:hypothetical protein